MTGPFTSMASAGRSRSFVAGPLPTENREEPKSSLGKPDSTGVMVRNLQEDAEIAETDVFPDSSAALRAPVKSDCLDPSSRWGNAPASHFAAANRRSMK